MCVFLLLSIVFHVFMGVLLCLLVNFLIGWPVCLVIFMLPFIRLCRCSFVYARLRWSLYDFARCETTLFAVLVSQVRDIHPNQNTALEITKSKIWSHAGLNRGPYGY